MAPSIRQKSLAGPITVEIPRPTQSNGLLNKSASSSSSLYQQCSQLRARLLQIPDFHLFFDRTASEQNPDPVTHLWDTLALGAPLCYLYNLLPPPSIPIDLDVHPTHADADRSNVKATKIAIIKFVMAVQKMQQRGEWEETDLFQVTELTERNMNGFVKVISTVTSLVDRLPPDVFTAGDDPSPVAGQSALLTPGSPMNPSLPNSEPSLSVKEMDRKYNINELINTERKFVQDLEVMHKYSIALSQRSVIDQDTILELFPGLNRLLDFQRRFLIKMEQVYEVPWPEQRWGKCFSDCEHEFVVYGPYCVNYEHAVDVLVREEQHLMECADILHPKSDLPAFLIKPVQRICKYPLLLESLLKACSPDEYQYYDELVEAVAVTKRVTNRINEAQRIAENRQIVKALEARIEDWKGHHIVNFGHLLLQDFFNVTKSDVDREYHVFLFQKIILCCKEDPRATLPLSKKVSKSNSLLKKQAPNPATLASGNFGAAAARNSNVPLLLKGRIFLNNVIEAVPVGKGVSHDLRVSWKGDDDTEHFTLRCRNDEQMQKWEKQINQLILAGRRRTQSGASNSTSPAMARLANGSAEPSNLVTFQNSDYPGIRQPPSSSSRSTTPHPGHLDANGFDLDEESDYMYHSALQPVPTSGRGTPIGRRTGAAQSMPPERDVQPGYERRARTEDYNGVIMQQWRVNSGIPPPPTPAGAFPMRPNQSRMSSNVALESNYGGMSSKGSLRTQQSSTKLRSTYENETAGDLVARTSSAASGRSYSSQGSSSRMRSASISSPYAAPKPQQPPPLPNGYPSQPQPVDGRGVKRDSNSSNSTDRSSDFSAPQSTSPVTPFGSSDSSLAHGTLRHAISNVTLSNGTKPPPASGPLTVKVKVHYNEDLFVIIVNRHTDFQELIDKVGKKIRLCGGRKEGGALRIRYRDEDGDMVSLGSDEDVQMAFDTSRVASGGQVTLFVA